MPISRTSLVLLASLGALGAAPLFAGQRATLQARVASSQTVSFNVYLPLQHRDQLEKLIADLHTSSSAQYQKWLTPAQFNERFAVPASSVQAVMTQLRADNLTVTQVSPHSLHVTGSATDVEHALTTQLRTGVFPNGRRKVVASSGMLPPSAITNLGAIVTGLSPTIRMRTHARRVTTSNRYSTAGSYWFTDLKQAYQWPSYTTYTGAGVTIGILMSGDYNPSDMDLYFGHEKLATPRISTVQVLGGAPYDPNGDSLETHLDLQQSGGMAPKASLVLYNLPDLSDDSILAGLSQIVESNKVDVVSMSFGGPEIFYTPAYNGGEDFTYLLREQDDLYAQGTAQGITFIASSGDQGALPAPALACFDADATSSCGSFQVSAEFPASSPHVVGVGGTNLKTTHTAGSLNSAYVSEQAYANPLDGDIFYGTPATGGYWGSGGGNSVVFRKPLFQLLSNTGSNMRTVPDVSLHMGGCPAEATCTGDESSDIATLDGHLVGLIGTSASAPDFAGLTALSVQRYGTRLGNENYYIYALAALQNAGLPIKAFHTGIPGYNGLYSTTSRGYNRVLGNGTVIGKQFLLAPLVPVAGTPQTPTNP